MNLIIYICVCAITVICGLSLKFLCHIGDTLIGYATCLLLTSDVMLHG